MRVLLFTWEFPPRIIGQLSHYVNRLAVELVKHDVDVHVVTYHNSWVGYNQGADGVKAYRISNPIKTHINILTWVLSLNQEVERVSADIYYSVKRDVDLIDVHDWHFVPAAISLTNALKIPFVFSIDSIENDRSHGSIAPLSLSIKSIESLGTNEAQKVVAKSDLMKQGINQQYNLGLDKVQVVSPDSPTWIEEILQVYKSILMVPAT